MQVKMQDGGVNNMADLTELYKTIAASAPDPLAWQKGLVGNYILQNEQLNLQEKQRQIAEEQRLRELFQRSANPNMSEIGAISPQFAQKYGESQLEMMRKQAELANLTGQLNERTGKLAAGALGSNADQYDADIKSGMPPDIAMEKFHTANGRSISQLQDAGHKLPPGTYDPQLITPDAAHRGAQAYGIMTNRTKAEQEAQLAESQTYARGGAERRMGPMPSFEQRYGGVEMTPQGAMYKPPVPMMQPAEIPKGARSEALTDADIQMMQQQFQSLPNGSPEKARIGAMLADAVKQRLPSGQFITPEQRQERERKAKVEETTAIAEAKGEVEKKAEAKDKFALIAALPNDSEVLDLLQKSITGAPEALLKGPVASALHIENQAQTATTVLKSLAQTVKNLATKAKGDLNLQEVKDYDEAMGALANEDLTPMARYAAYTTAVGIVKRKLSAQHPDLAAQYQGNAPKDTIPTPKTIEEAKSLPKGTVFRVPETGELRINQ
jgi:hypothetical protein